VGIVPLVVEHRSTRLGPVRVLRYPVPDWATVLGPIGPNPTATLAVAMRHLQQTPRDWDVIDLRGIDLRGGDFRRTEAALDRVGLHPRKTTWHAIGVVDLTDDAQPRSNWHRRRRSARGTLDALPPLEFERYRPDGSAHGDDDPAWEMVERGLSMPRRIGPSGRGQSGSLDIRPFHQAAIDAGGAEMAVLRAGNQPVAWWYGYHCAGRIDAVALGWDDRLGGDAPAVTLLDRLIADSRRLGDRSIMFGPGWPGWVAEACTTVRPTFRYTHFPMAARSQLARFGRWLAAG
jgi:hypothetical protein